MILNLKILSFLEPKYIIEQFKKIKKEFLEKEDKLEPFLEYFEKTWISGGVFDMKDWNYSLAILEGEEEIKVSQKLHFTNNAVEGANSLINSLLTNGKKYYFF